MIMLYFHNILSQQLIMPVQCASAWALVVYKRGVWTKQTTEGGTQLEDRCMSHYRKCPEMDLQWRISRSCSKQSCYLKNIKTMFRIALIYLSLFEISNTSTCPILHTKPRPIIKKKKAFFIPDLDLLKYAEEN